MGPSYYSNKALRRASRKGHYEIVKLLLNYLENKRRETTALAGNTKVLLSLAYAVDPSDENSKAFYLASKNGHHKVVELFLADQRADPSYKNNKALSVLPKMVTMKL